MLREHESQPGTGEEERMARAVGVDLGTTNSVVAVLEAATTPKERIVVATLDRIAAETEAAGIQSPALIAIGRIVAMRAALTGPR